MFQLGRERASLRLHAGLGGYIGVQWALDGRPHTCRHVTNLCLLVYCSRALCLQWDCTIRLQDDATNNSCDVLHCCRCSCRCYRLATKIMIIKVNLVLSLRSHRGVYSCSWDLRACHTGSHCATYHPPQVNTHHQAGWYSIYLHHGAMARLSWFVVYVLKAQSSAMKLGLRAATATRTHWNGLMTQNRCSNSKLKTNSTTFAGIYSRTRIFHGDVKPAKTRLYAVSKPLNKCFFWQKIAIPIPDSFTVF